MTGNDRNAAKPGPPHRPERPGSRKQDWIASQLRRVYDEALQEEVPADMLALLARLDETPDEAPDGESQG